MSEMIVREYKGVKIRERADGYQCITDMAKAAGKLVGNYMQNADTKAFIKELAFDIGIPISTLIEKRKGGDRTEQGTWVHPYLALHFAAWCCPAFHVQVMKWTHKIVTTGHVDIRPFDQQIVSALNLLTELAKQQAGIITGLNERIERIEAALSGATGAPANPLYSLKATIRTKWPTATAKQIERVWRRVRVSLSQRNVMTMKMGISRSAEIAIDELNLDLLDKVIAEEKLDAEMEAAEHEPATPLLDGVGVVISVYNRQPSVN